MISIVSVSVAVALILNLIVFIGVFFLVKDIVATKLLITQIHGAISMMVSRSAAHEQQMKQLNASLADFVSTASNMIDKMDMIVAFSVHGKNGKMFRTQDGKYVAGSMQELINKMKEDGVEDFYLSQDDMESLRNMFDQDDDESSSDDEDEDLIK